MGTIARRGDVWRAQIARAGIRESRTFATRQQAVDWIAGREADILSGKVLAGRQTLVEASHRWESAKHPGRSDQTRLRALRQFEWAKQPIAQLKPETIAEWRDARLVQVKPATVIREMTTLRSVIEYARRDLGWIAVNPIRDVRAPKEPAARTRLISAPEIAAMIDELDYAGKVETVRHEVAVALLLALETAMRAGEICGLRWERITGAVAHLPKTKNGDARDVPLSKAALALLKTMRAKKLIHVRKPSDGRVFHITPATLDTLFRGARRDAGLEGFTFHDSRANALTRLSKILSPLELARMAGHRDLGSLMTYYRESAASIAERLG